ncbi:hypothetical protein NP493_10g04016 [Ridgeia piscesae]|uniref:Uncharacterized protein n=1 Tax=Ridgeia piscesae TaxID=27915 RepID=A0AAD9UL56_RIDPI|nr:hypothetical protein NP493_10g04016 [Ridgeia piscesae]
MHLQWKVSPNVSTLLPDVHNVTGTHCDKCHEMYTVSLHINKIVTMCTRCVNRSDVTAVTSVTRSTHHVIKCTHCVTRFTCSDKCHQMYLHCQMSPHHRNPHLQVLADVCLVTCVYSDNCHCMS